MNKILEAIKDAITGPMTEMNIIVDSVKYETEGNYNFLTTQISLSVTNVDDVITSNSNNPVTSSAIYQELLKKQETLKSIREMQYYRYCAPDQLLR